MNKTEQNIITTSKGQYYMAFFSAMIVSFVLGLIEICSLINYGTMYDKFVITFVSIIAIFWITVFIIYGILSGGRKNYNKCEIIIAVCMFLLLAIFAVSSVWCSGYLSLNPVAALGKGIERSDELQHSCVAGSIATYGIRSNMVNGLTVYRYHTLSHFFLGMISKITGIPSFFVYNWFYPTIFIPLYFFLFLVAISDAKYFFSKEQKISLFDLLAVLAFVIGFLPRSVYENHGAWKSSWIISESFLVGLSVVLLYFHIITRNFFQNNSVARWICIYLINPVFIVLASFGKISCGALLTAGIMWFLFRKHSKEIKFYIPLALYVLCLFVSYKLTSNNSSSEIGAGIHPFSFALNYSRTAPHFYYLLAFTGAIFVVWYRLRNCNSFKTIFFSTDYVFEEILIICCVCGSLPGILWKIYGGSAGYFSAPPSLFALVLLIGYGLPNKIFDFIKVSKNIADKCIYIIAILSIFLTLFFNTMPVSFIRLVKNSFLYHEPLTSQTFYKNIERINDYIKTNRKKYVAFIDDDAEIWDIWKDDLPMRGNSLFVYPAVLNILCLNEVYETDGVLYNRANIPIASSNMPQYGYNTVPKEKKKTYEDVLSSTLENIDKIIYIHSNTYEIVDVKK